MNFVTEKAAWTKHKKLWRHAEMKLLAIVSKVARLTELAKQAGEDAGAKGKMEEAIDKLHPIGVKSFIESRTEHQETMGLQHQLSRDWGLNFNEAQACQGCKDLLVDLQEIVNVGKDLEFHADLSDRGSIVVKHGLEWIYKVNVPEPGQDYSSLEPEPEEPDPEQSPAYAATNDMGRVRQDELAIPLALAMKSAAFRERKRCIAMLKVLAETLPLEYGSSGQAKWGGEDRCA